MSAIPDSELSVINDGPGAAEIWSGSSLIGTLYAQDGGMVLRLESHARGPLTVSAEALERALARAQLEASSRAVHARET